MPAAIQAVERVSDEAPPALVLRPRGRAPVPVAVEIVHTPEAIESGLMHRRYLPADHGMFFYLGVEQVHVFWMRDTFLPLDIIFIGRDARVVGVVENAQPLTDDDRAVAAPSLYVLEVNAGFAAAHGISAGTRVDFNGLPR